VARLLLDMSMEEHGKRVVKQKISKQDMARMIGASREMVSKVMRDLEIGGYIICADDVITITGA
jgi:CRP/FNR family cyclic AMP-dependent transcriptional regulator